MFENRSFDHVLGRLYTDAELRPGQSFAGLQRGTHENTAPDGTVVAAHVYEGSTDVVMSQPDPDPGEFYPHVNTQWFGTVDPPGNGRPRAERLRGPVQRPGGHEPPHHVRLRPGLRRELPARARCRADPRRVRARDGRLLARDAPGLLDPGEVLRRLRPLVLRRPVADLLQPLVPPREHLARVRHERAARRPREVARRPGRPDAVHPARGRGKSWRVYFDADQVVSLTGFLHAPSIERYWKTNFRSMAQFHEDAANGTLPDYAFVEPRMMFDHNDMHPPVSRPKVVAEPTARRSTVR